MEIAIIYRGKHLVKFTRDLFLSKLENYYKGDVGLLTEAFNKMEQDLKKELLKL